MTYVTLQITSDGVVVTKSFEGDAMDLSEIGEVVDALVETLGDEGFEAEDETDEDEDEEDF